MLALDEGNGWYRVELSHNLLKTIGPITVSIKEPRIKETQRFGRLEAQYGDFGELRKQKKKPYKEILYVFVDCAGATPIQERTLRALNHTTNDQLTDYIKMIGQHAGVNLAQENAEKLLDLAYAELNRRVNADQKV